MTMMDVPWAGTAEDPYADEFAQRSAEYARHAALEDPTPAQGMPGLNETLSEQLADTPLAAAAEAATLESTGELPQRVPAPPDVPPAPDPLEPAPGAEMPQLSRIASHLRREDALPEERADGIDVDAVLAAVRAVAGIRDARLRMTAAGAHHLRLDLAEGADPAAISRMVARMLQDQMGIDAAPAVSDARPSSEADAPNAAASEAEPAEPDRPVDEVSSAEPRAQPGVLPMPRAGAGATPPAPAASHDPVVDQPREPRRRHPVNVPRRSPELRGYFRAAGEQDLPAVATPPPLRTDREQGPRAVIDHVQTSTFGLDATVEVRLSSGDQEAAGVASGPAVDAYVLRLCAAATADAIGNLLRTASSSAEPGRCFVEHAAIVPMGSCDVAVVVVLLVCDGWVEQLAGSALVSGDPRRAVVRAALSAVNRRLAALLP